jgi:hypothetical protein
MDERLNALSCDHQQNPLPSSQNEQVFFIKDTVVFR